MITWRDQILRKHHEFQSVWSSGQSFATPRCVFYWQQSKRGYSRFAVVVSKKVSKRAVDRNYLKRMHRESFRRVVSSLPAIDMVVVVRKSQENIKGSCFAEIYLLWKELCQHLKTS